MLSALAILVVGIQPVSSVSPLKVLVFSKTAGYRHDCIPSGQEMFRRIAEKEGNVVRFTEDASWFEPKTLKSFDVVVFLCTTGDVLNADQQTAFESFIRNGGGYVGIHAAADTEYDWPFYGEVVGAWFAGHPAIQETAVLLEDAKHPTTKHLPKQWLRKDEWYNYKANPRGKVHVLLTVDESTYQGGTMGKDHPIAWCREIDKGRAWYTGLGHVAESYSDPLFVQMIDAAVQWSGLR